VSAATWTFVENGSPNNYHKEQNFKGDTAATLDDCKAYCEATPATRWMSYTSDGSDCVCYDSNTLSSSYQELDKTKTYELTTGGPAIVAPDADNS